jgi:hypothetical protein
MGQVCILGIIGLYRDLLAQIQNGLNMMIKNLELLMIERFTYITDSHMTESITRVGIVHICFCMKAKILKISLIELYLF